MSTAAAVRAGRTFVEVLMDDTQFRAAVTRVEQRMVKLSRSLKTMGAGMAATGAVMGLPMVLAARQAAKFEDALLELKAAEKSITPATLRLVREEAIKLSNALGESPEDVMRAFTLLIKAGTPVQDALNGAAKSAVQFARVSGVAAEEAATFMKVATNMFSVTPAQAVDTLSAAADSTEATMAGLVEAFGLVGAVAAGTDQTLFGTAQAIAALAKSGIHGEEAGTGIKVFLSRLIAPSQEASEALGKLGLTVEMFRDKAGDLLPLSQMVDILNKQLGHLSNDTLDKIMRDDSIVRVFGDRGIKVMKTFAVVGKDGMEEVARAMENSRSVAEKHQIVMSGITGTILRLQNAVKLMAMAFMDGGTPALKAFANASIPVMDGIAFLLTRIPAISPVLATMAASLFGLGVVATAVGFSCQFVAYGLGGLVLLKPVLVAALGVISRAVYGLAAAFGVLRAVVSANPLGAFLILSLVASAAVVPLNPRAKRKDAAAAASAAAPAGGDPAQIQRDQNRDPLLEPGAPGDAMAAGGERGKSLGTFAAAVASQMGIGPALSSQQQMVNFAAMTAANTEELVKQSMEMPQKMAAAIFENIGSFAPSLPFRGGRALPTKGPNGEWVQPNDSLPPAADLQAGMNAPGVRGGVGVRNNGDLLTASERTAVASEEARNFLRQLVERAANGGLSFA
jgi:TP901 family phage tail tape measure protein